MGRVCDEIRQHDEVMTGLTSMITLPFFFELLQCVCLWECVHTGGQEKLLITVIDAEKACHVSPRVAMTKEGNLAEGYKGSGVRAYHVERRD